jgi:hypothetical protein
VATDPPTAGPRDSDVTAQDLARSGGVIEPKRLKNGTVIAPPRSNSYGMPTLPDVTRHDLPGVDLKIVSPATGLLINYLWLHWVYLGFSGV